MSVRGFESRNLGRMVTSAEALPDAEIVSTLSTELSRSHLLAILALKTTHGPTSVSYAYGGSEMSCLHLCSGSKLSWTVLHQGRAICPKAAVSDRTSLLPDPWDS